MTAGGSLPIFHHHLIVVQHPQQLPVGCVCALVQQALEIGGWGGMTGGEDN